MLCLAVILPGLVFAEIGVAWLLDWELVGLTSVLLIAFFQHRDEPRRNVLRVFAVYRGSDVGLLTAVPLMNHLADTAFYGTWFSAAGTGGTGSLSGEGVPLIRFLLLLATMGKGAQVRFSGWQPRAMEGHTPSSAIFYGALSIHAGPYLLLRAQPLLAQSPVLSATVMGVGLVIALHATLGGIFLGPFSRLPAVEAERLSHAVDAVHQLLRH